MVTCQRLGFQDLDEMHARLNREDLYDWMAVACLQGWMVWPEQQSDEAQDENVWHDLLRAHYAGT